MNAKKNDDYGVRILTGRAKTIRMQEIRNLTLQGLVEMGDVNPTLNSAATTNRIFDSHSNTHVVIAERRKKIIGTLSCTKDSEQGLPLDAYFPEQLNYLRLKGHHMLCGWRYGILRKERRLDMASDFIFSALDQAYRQNCDLGVFFFHQRFERYYRKFLRGQLIARRVLTLDGETQLPVLLMTCEVVANWERHMVARETQWANAT